MTYLTDLATAARKSGLPVVEVAGWKSRGRPASKGPFNPGKAGLVVAHHTGDTLGKSYSGAELKKREATYANGTLKNGFAALPGPLCHLGLGRDGTVYVIAAGRANHAGTVRSIGKMKAGDGNRQSIGIEAMNSGLEGWTPVQLAAYHKLVAALEDHYGFGRGTVRGHGEVSTAGKWDPGVKDKQTGRGRMLDMDVFRAAVRAVGKIVQPAEPKPPVVVPPPSVELPDWFTIALINYGAASIALKKLGAWTKWLRRRAGAVALVTQGDVPDVVVALECGGGRALSYITKAHAKVGLRRVPKGGSGRWIFVNDTAVIEHSGMFQPPKHKGNDKPAPWFSGTIGGSEAMVVGFHLDPTDPTSQVPLRQARSIIGQAKAKAKALGIAESNIIWAGDSASDNLVRTDAFNAAGITEVFSRAKRKVNQKIKSYNRYKAPVNGPSVDIIGVGPGRPVRVANQRLTTKVDHQVRVAIISRKA